MGSRIGIPNSNSCLMKYHEQLCDYWASHTCVIITVQHCARAKNIIYGNLISQDFKLNILSRNYLRKQYKYKVKIIKAYRKISKKIDLLIKI